jgi:transcriptional regulator of arginine metabolism
MSRAVREQAILDIIRHRPVATQLELVAALGERGIVATQATVSRDIQQLGLVKVPLGDGGHRYDRPAALDAAPSAARHALAEAMQVVTGLAPGEALLVVRTLPGRAAAVAIALDDAAPDGLVGTVAGDDTVLVVARDGAARDRLRALLGDLSGA